MNNCRKCNDELVVNENWYPSQAKNNNCVCIKCTKSYQRYYQQGHRDEFADYQRKYRQKHKDEIAVRNHKYYQENREKFREKNRRYYARKLNATIKDVDEQAVCELYNNTCFYCGSKESLELDHVVPLNGGGAHCEDNLVIACRSCNASKSDKPLIKWIQTRPDLQVWVM